LPNKLRWRRELDQLGFQKSKKDWVHAEDDKEDGSGAFLLRRGVALKEGSCSLGLAVKIEISMREISREWRLGKRIIRLFCLRYWGSNLR
jgi:hypothetical protein